MSAILSPPHTVLLSPIMMYTSATVQFAVTLTDPWMIYWINNPIIHEVVTLLVIFLSSNIKLQRSNIWNSENLKALHLKINHNYNCSHLSIFIYAILSDTYLCLLWLSRRACLIKQTHYIFNAIHSQWLWGTFYQHTGIWKKDHNELTIRCHPLGDATTIFECPKTSLKISQHWFMQQFGAVTQKAIMWANVDQC